MRIGFGLSEVGQILEIIRGKVLLSEVQINFYGMHILEHHLLASRKHMHEIPNGLGRGPEIRIQCLLQRLLTLGAYLNKRSIKVIGGEVRYIVPSQGIIHKCGKGEDVKLRMELFGIIHVIL